MRNEFRGRYVPLHILGRAGDRISSRLVVFCGADNRLDDEWCKYGLYWRNVLSCDLQCHLDGHSIFCLWRKLDL